MSAVRTRVDPITAAVIAGALDSIAVEMGHKLARMSYSSIIRESEDFGCVLCDDAGAAALRVVAVDAAPVGPDPRLHRGHQPPLRRARRTSGSPATSSSTTTPTTAPRTSPTSAFVVPDLPRRRARRLLGDDRAPPRPRRAHARAAAGSSTRPTPTPRACSSTRSRSRRRAAATSGSGSILRDNCRAPQLVVGDMEAQVAACQDRRRALRRADRPLRPRDRPGARART